MRQKKNSTRTPKDLRCQGNIPPWTTSDEEVFYSVVPESTCSLKAPFFLLVLVDKNGFFSVSHSLDGAGRSVPLPFPSKHPDRLLEENVIEKWTPHNLRRHTLWIAICQRRRFKFTLIAEPRVSSSRTKNYSWNHRPSGYSSPQSVAVSATL